MPTRRECQSIIFKLGWKFGVSPKAIDTKLLSEADKQALSDLDAKFPGIIKRVQGWSLVVTKTFE